MEDSGLIERVDSLWFFSNVLNSRSHSMASGTDEKPAEFYVNRSPKPPSPVSKNQPENAEVLVQLRKCPDCGEFSAETEAQMATSENDASGVEMPPAAEAAAADYEKWRRRRRRRQGQGRRRVVGESDMGFSEEGVDGSWLVEGGYGCEWEMPPLTDGIAMKQHLRSWAYAVACTVR